MFLRPNFHLKSTFEAVFVLLTLASCHPEAYEKSLWWASLSKKSYRNSIMWREADERALWWVSLWERWCHRRVIVGEGEIECLSLV